MAEPSTRAKWRALRSARVSTPKKYLTGATLSERRCYWPLSHQMRCGIVLRLPNYLIVDLNPPENRLRIDTGRDGEQSQKLEPVPCCGAGEIRPEFEIPPG